MRLQEIRDFIGGAASGPSWGRSETLSETLQDLIAGIGLPSILRAARDSARDIAGRSYRHANGFDKIVLCQDTRHRFKLRLHCWQSSIRACDDFRKEDAHNHRWPFATKILVGGYRFQELREDPRGDPMCHYRYFPVQNDGSFRMDPLGEKRLLVHLDLFLSRESEYSMDENVVHRVLHSTGNLTCSLMLQGPTLKSSTDVFRVDRSVNLACFKESVRRLSIEDLETTIEHLERELSHGLYTGPCFNRNS